MISRALEPVLTQVAGQYPVVTLTGPRQSGKTTLVREAFPGHAYASADLLKNLLNRGREADLYFWRDSAGHEIDVVVDRGRDRVAVEIKSAQTVVPDFFAGIDFWRKLVGDPEAPASLIYGGDRSFRRFVVAVQSWSTL